ncbi:MAG: 23S rRNA (adenine(2503)-C(2))-methyltransferase RlmN [Bacteroidota bacterium]
MNPHPVPLVGLSGEELVSFAGSLGESPYRGRQLYRWIYRRGARSFAEMTDLARDFRNRLEREASLEGIRPAGLDRSADGTLKFLFELPDGARVESVLIPASAAFPGSAPRGAEERTRRTACVSTQAGCPLDCAFCATARIGFRRNLTAGEIVDQVRHLSHAGTVSNVVFMGMGEPLMNYGPSLQAADILASGVGIASRRITISTAGWADGIRRLADERRPVNLAVSLHSVDQATRERLMPVARRFPLSELLASVAYYYRVLRRRITYEMIFFEGLNDGDRDAEQLVRFARRVPCKINVISFHPVGFAGPSPRGADLRPSPRMEEIVDHLRTRGLTVFVRGSAGRDIRAACGQLALAGTPPSGGAKDPHAPFLPPQETRVCG